MRGDFHADDGGIHRYEAIRSHAFKKRCEEGADAIEDTDGRKVYSRATFCRDAAQLTGAGLNVTRKPLSRLILMPGITGAPEAQRFMRETGKLLNNLCDTTLRADDLFTYFDIEAFRHYRYWWH